MRPGTLLRWRALKHIFKSEIENGCTILDIGGYDGFISYNLNSIFPDCKIVVVDIDSSGLKTAESHGLNILYASALDLPIQNNSVDIVLCLDLIEHIEDDNKLIKEISRVLKKTGKVILTTPIKRGDLIPLIGEDKMNEIHKKWGHVRKGYGIEQLKTLFQNNELAIIKAGKYFNLFSRYAYLFLMLPSIPLKFRRIIYNLFIMLEPYIKFGTREHIIVGTKLNF